MKSPAVFTLGVIVLLLGLGWLGLNLAAIFGDVEINHATMMARHDEMTGAHEQFTPSILVIGVGLVMMFWAGRR